MNHSKFSVMAAVKYGFYSTIEKIGFLIGIQCCLLSLFLGIFLLFLLLLGFLLNIPFKELVSTLALSSHQELALQIKNIVLKNVLSSPLFITMLGLFIMAYNLIYSYCVVVMVRISLDIYDYQKSYYKRLYQPVTLILKTALAAILYSFLVGLGLLCFIMPGIIIALRCYVYPQIIVDKNVGIIEALKESARITKGSCFKLMAIQLIFAFIHGLAFFTFGLIYILTFPALYLTKAYVYRKLQAV